MELQNNHWIQSLKLEKEVEKRDGRITRQIIQDALKISQNYAQFIVSALQNKEIIKQINISNYNYSDKKEFIISDIHIPFQDNALVEVALNDADKYKPDIITLLGDITDFYQLSNFTKRSGKKPVSKEIEEAKTFLKNLRKRFPKAKIIFHPGNHEARLERYILEQAPVIADLLENMLEEKLELHENNIQYEPDIFKIGRLYHLHGHQKKGVAKVKSMWKFIHSHFIMGHGHKVQDEHFSHIVHSGFYGIQSGHLANVKELEYAPMNDWVPGYIKVKYSNNGNYQHEKCILGEDI